MRFFLLDSSGQVPIFWLYGVVNPFSPVWVCLVPVLCFMGWFLVLVVMGRWFFRFLGVIAHLVGDELMGSYG